MRPIPSSRSHFFSLHLLALLAHGAIYAGQGAQQRYPGSNLYKSFHDAQLQHAQRNDYDRQQQEQRLPQQGGQQQQYQSTLATLSGITGGSSVNNRKKRQHAPGGQGLVHSAQRGPYGEHDGSLPDAIEVSGADLGTDPPHLDGVYIREREAEINGAPHFKRRSKRGSRSPPVHLFFTGREWMLHLDADSELDINHCLAYSEISEINPLKTNRRWAVRVGQAWVRRPHMKVVEATTDDLEPKWIAHEAKEPAREPQGIVDSGDEGRTIHASTTYNSPTVATAAEEEEAEAGGERRSISDAALNRRLLPLYLVFVLDAIGLGVALPVLPFYVMGLQATALQLAVVISSNYIAQSFGCIITGNLSDVVGRKPVIIGCLLGTVISNIVVARSKTLAGVAWGRIIGGITGGLTPIAQAAVADVVPVQSLPKFLGRIQACVGLGFVLGPMTMTILHRLLRISSGDTFYAAALFPLVGLLFAAFRVSETKVRVVAEAGAVELSTSTDVTLKAKHRFDPEMTTVETRRKPGWPRRDQREEGRVQRRESVKEGETNRSLGHDHGVEMAGVQKIEDDGGGGDEDVDRGLTFDSPGAAKGGVRSRVRNGTAESKVGERVKAARAPEVIPRAVMLLVGNGFLLMYAFSIETIYAMFLKDNFGYGESVLSMVFALNGLAVGALQLLGMRHLVRLLGKHVMLIAGNVLLAAGMVGVALSRKPAVHFALFTVHIMGYSLADTALVALISRYSSPGTQGRSLGLNQAAQSMARVVSPVVAGVLYEWSKRRDSLPLGALPYLVGATFPLAGVAVPFWLYLRSIEAKKQIGVYYTRQEDSAHVGRGAVAESGVAFASGKSL